MPQSAGDNSFEVLIPVSYEWASYDLNGEVTLQAAQAFGFDNQILNDGSADNVEGVGLTLNFDESPSIINDSGPLKIEASGIHDIT